MPQPSAGAVVARGGAASTSIQRPRSQQQALEERCRQAGVCVRQDGHSTTSLHLHVDVPQHPLHPRPPAAAAFRLCTHQQRRPLENDREL